MDISDRFFGVLHERGFRAAWSRVFVDAKNAVNILGKNFVVFGIASLAFWIVGWAIMFGDGNDLFGSSGFLVMGADNSPA